jgi:hypothetical protein
MKTIPHLKLVWNRDTDPGTFFAGLLAENSLVGICYRNAMVDPLPKEPLPADELEAFKQHVRAMRYVKV